MFALRFPPHQRQSSTDLNHTPRSGSILKLECKLNILFATKTEESVAGVSSLYVQAVGQLVWGCCALVALVSSHQWMDSQVIHIMTPFG